MTYVEAISELQNRSVDALKVAQSTQIASLRATRDLAAALVVPPLALFAAPPLISAITDLTRSFAFRVLDLQLAYIKGVTDTLSAPARTLRVTAEKPLALATSAPPEVAAELQNIEEAVIVAPLEVMPFEVEPATALAVTVASEPLDTAAPSVELPVIEASAFEAPPAAEAPEIVATPVVQAPEIPAVPVAEAPEIVAVPPAEAPPIVTPPAAETIAMDPTTELLSRTLPAPKAVAPAPPSAAASAAPKPNPKKSKPSANAGNRARPKRGSGK
jgi:hypothetical protein